MRELILLGVTLFLSLGAPVYIYFRTKMVESETKGSDLSAVRVFKLTATIAGANIIGFWLMLAILGDILLNSVISTKLILLSVILLTVMGLAFYGSGIYITSVVLEDYTLPQLRRSNKFKTQFIATHLFHGPISHVQIFSGYMLTIFILAVMDTFTGAVTTSLTPYLLAAGALSGTMYAAAQIFNGTYPYQFITSFLSLIFLAIYLYISNKYLFDYSVPVFFFGFSVVFQSIIFSYMMLFGLKNKKMWDMSGW